MSVLYGLIWFGKKMGFISTEKSDPEVAWQAELLDGAGSLLWYPLTYTALTLPLSITRMAEIADHAQWGPKVAFTAAALYASGGFVNAILYTAEFNGIISWKWGAWRQAPARKLSIPLLDYNVSRVGSGSSMV